MEENYLYKGLREKLVNEIRRKGIRDEKVLEAIRKVPRHLFMESSFIKFAYKDQAFPIGSGQTISQPYTVAFQTELLDVQPHQKVLEIGTGSGYQAAVLIEMGARVYTIERQKELYMKVQMQLPKMGYKPSFFYGDGYQGLPTYGPFDRILITAAAPEIPSALIQQLRTGGKMVIPLGGPGSQVMTLIEKTGPDKYTSREKGWFVFVPMLKGKE
ncbi:MAG: protein-L-isoaspartate(D-aspartate) O-methyltransferase [Bacteroidales bacterium]|nr:protein-L-isoaspartate(D-aspartate) O-methyltransferase [Bacteroidales bacterium]MBN2762434.1 protein-L-isoaspartate(D-aspartate) O-methyltransferase [Bacteroidales bacterium]